MSEETKTLKERLQELPEEVKTHLGRVLYFLEATEPQLWKTTAKKYGLELWSEDKFQKLLVAILFKEVSQAKVAFVDRALEAERLRDEENKKKEELLKSLENDDIEE